MANGVGTIGNLPGTVNEDGAVVVSSAGVGGTSTAGAASLLNLQGKTASGPALVVVFV